MGGRAGAETPQDRLGRAAVRSYSMIQYTMDDVYACVCALGVPIVCEGGRKGFEGKTELTLSLFLPSLN